MHEGTPRKWLPPSPLLLPLWMLKPALLLEWQAVPPLSQAPGLYLFVCLFVCFTMLQWPVIDNTLPEIGPTLYPKADRGDPLRAPETNPSLCWVPGGGVVRQSSPSSPNHTTTACVQGKVGVPVPVHTCGDCKRAHNGQHAAPRLAAAVQCQHQARQAVPCGTQGWDVGQALGTST